jgi:glycosyltransferase involved in cell wall biosynthesis
MYVHLKIITKTDWPSFKNVAAGIRDALEGVCTCTVSNWNKVKPGGRILFVGTFDNQTLKFLSSLLRESDVVLYATTEGLSHLNASSRGIAERLKVVAVSGFVKQMIEQLGIPVAGVVHHGIDMRRTNIDLQFKMHMPKADGHTVFLTVSANHPRKGLDQLLKAFRAIEEHDPEAFLILHSQREGYYDLERLVRSLNIERILLTNSFGRTTQNQLNTLYESCTSYVQPSHSEGFGLPVLEAFRFAKPTIAVDAPPFNEVIENGRNGILVPVQGVKWFNYRDSISFKLNLYEAEGLARAMSTIVSNRKLLTDMRRNIRNEKWSWDSQKLYPALLQYFS